MIRHFALAGSLLVACAIATAAQTHPGTHTRPAGHDQMEHTALDSARHAALHALLHGSWDGRMSDHGVSTAVNMSIDHDSLHNVLMTVRAGGQFQTGPATDFAVKGDTLQWAQIVSGKSCRATAVVNEGTHHAPGTMKGTMTCDDREMRFMLEKKTG